MSPNRSKRTQIAAKSKAIRQELAQLNPNYGQQPVTINDIAWMARNEELLPMRPMYLDSKECSSNLYGPSMRVGKCERIELIELDENGRVIWSA